MPHITIFGDIHANLPALDAVLADMTARGLHEDRYCLGDLVGYGTFANACVERIRALGIPTLMGNYDQGVGNQSDDCGCAYKTDVERRRGELSIAWTNAHTSDENRAFLRSLPAHIPLVVGGMRVLLVHGSPRKVNEYLFEDRPNDYFERILDAADAEVLVCGHTHLPYHKVLASGRHVVNAGSVGKPKDGDPRAGYIVLDIPDATAVTEPALSVTFVRVAYDVETTARAIEATPEEGGMPHIFAQMLRDGRG
jgi:diadenosine tetraphosphatase ApaH/serine/threonine PP2A family protein phosphatase